MTNEQAPTGPEAGRLPEGREGGRSPEQASRETPDEASQLTELDGSPPPVDPMRAIESMREPFGRCKPPHPSPDIDL